MKNMAVAGGIKKFILAALLLCLVLEQIQVEAKTCCPSTIAKIAYIACRYSVPVPRPREWCAKNIGCEIISGNTCQPPYDHLTLDPDTEEVNVLGFCKLGCASSVCNKMNAGDRCCRELQPSICSRFCNEHVRTATVVA